MPLNPAACLEATGIAGWKETHLHYSSSFCASVAHPNPELQLEQRPRDREQLATSDATHEKPQYQSYLREAAVIQALGQASPSTRASGSGSAFQGFCHLTLISKTCFKYVPLLCSVVRELQKEERTTRPVEGRSSDWGRCAELPGRFNDSLTQIGAHLLVGLCIWKGDLGPRSHECQTRRLQTRHVGKWIFAFISFYLLLDDSSYLQAVR